MRGGQNQKNFWNAMFKVSLYSSFFQQNSWLFTQINLTAKQSNPHDLLILLKPKENHWQQLWFGFTKLKTHSCKTQTV